MMGFLRFAEEIDKIDNTDSTGLDHKLFLYSLIRGCRPEVCVEIGTNRGKTSLYMAHALYDNGRGELHTCDPVDYDQETTFSKFPQLSRYIHFHQKKGVDLDIDSIDFIFVDGFHEYEAVTEEIEYFLPRLTKEGLMVFHDCGGDNKTVGVNKAIEDARINAVWIPMSGKLRLYSNFRDYPC